MFNLWVTKLAPVAHIADYMSVHTFFAGIRILIAPFLGFFLVQWANIPAMVAVTGVLIFISISLVFSAAQISREIGAESRIS